MELVVMRSCGGVLDVLLQAIHSVLDVGADLRCSTREIAGTCLSSGQCIEIDGVFFSPGLDNRLDLVDRDSRIANRAVWARGQQPCQSAESLNRLRIKLKCPIIFSGGLGIAADVRQQIGTAESARLRLSM